MLKTTLILLTFILFQLTLINSYLIGIDLGTEFFKGTILTPKKPFTMLENLQSKTKTPTAISFKDDERGFGSEAIVRKSRFPKQVLTFFHEYLGQKYTAESVQKFIDNYFISYNMEEDNERQAVTISVTFDKELYSFSIEEIFGMLFRHIKFLADKFTGIDTKDCTVTVPNFFGYKQRLALVQAAQLSKLNLVSLISENVAAAVHFQMKKYFNTTENYIFYNMGSSYTQATLVRFTPKFETKQNVTKDVGNVIEVIGEAWDKNLGGNKLNYNFIRFLMNKFDQQPNRKGMNSVQNNPQVAERILPHAIKYKEILSANKEAYVSILGVDSGMNLEGKVTRAEFEEINNEEISRAYEPIQKLLNQTNLTLDNITQIELIGGSIRVPKIQEELKEKLGNFTSLLGTHMNGDDSMAFGAAFICANSSSNFKGARKYELYHGTNYEIGIKIRNLNNTGVMCTFDNSTDQEGCIRPLEKNATIFKVREKLDLQRKVTFKHDRDVEIDVYEKFENDPNENLLLTYKILGLDEVTNSIKQDNLDVIPKINLRFQIDLKGVISLKAEATYDQSLYLNKVIGPNNNTEYIYLPNYTDPLTPEELEKIDNEIKEAQSSNQTESEIMMLKMQKDVGKKRTHEMKKDMTVQIEHSFPKPLTPEGILAAKAKLDKLDKIDQDRIKSMELRNTLESTIYQKKEWLETSSASTYGKEDEIEKARTTLKDIDMWYEDEAFRADFKTLDEKFTELMKVFSIFDLREKTHKSREALLDKYYQELNKTLQDADKLIKSKPWVEEHYNTTFLKEIDAVQKWLEEKLEKQKSLNLNEDAELHGHQIEAKIGIIKREYYTMSRIPKPKAPPTMDNVKLEDFLRNNTKLEDLMKNANITAEDWEKLKNLHFNKTNENESNSEGKQEEQTNQDNNKAEEQTNSNEEYKEQNNQNEQGQKVDDKNEPQDNAQVENNKSEL